MRKVVCVYAVITNVSDDDSKADGQVDAVTTKVLKALEDELGQDPLVSLPRSASYLWTDESQNFHLCRKCERFGSAWNEVELVHGLPQGVLDKNGFVCDACRSNHTPE